MTDHDLTISLERISARILRLRGQNVMLDADLAELYGVETKVLNQAVRRNLERFPEDFMFQLSQEEAAAPRSHSVTLDTEADKSVVASRSQSVILNRGTHVKHCTYAFTEQELTADEATNLRYQFGTSNDDDGLRSQSATSNGRGGRRYCFQPDER